MRKAPSLFLRILQRSELLPAFHLHRPINIGRRATGIDTVSKSQYQIARHCTRHEDRDLQCVSLSDYCARQLTHECQVRLFR